MEQDKGAVPTYIYSNPGTFSETRTLEYEHQGLFYDTWDLRSCPILLIPKLDSYV